MKPTVWINVGVVAIYGTSLDAELHQHHAIQLIWSKAGEDCWLNGDKVTGPTIVASNVTHQLEMQEGWVLLIEPNSDLGDAIANLLGNEAFKSYDLPNYSHPAPLQEQNLASLFVNLFDSLAVPASRLSNNKSTSKDARLNTLLTELDECLKGQCIKPQSWRASQVANHLALSESRFLHLFRDELGISWRPYLLWRRSLCAIQAVISGVSATDAAHLAGFSDSAHLSRTFRTQFGMSMRQAKALFTNK